MFITTAGGGAIAGSLLGGLLGGGGGSASQTASKEPWSEAVPWIKSNLAQGQQLQNYYQANPFNQAQTQAYGNMADQSAYIRSLVPSLLQQMGNYKPFDRSNLDARPQGFTFMPQASSQMPQQAGFAGFQGANPVQSMPTMQPPVATPAPTAAPSQAGPYAYASNYWYGG